MNIFLQLTLVGADTGPFNLYTDNDSFDIPFISGVAKNNLTSGYYTVAPTGTTTVRIKSVSPSLCDSYVDVVLGSSPPASSTTTTTTTTCSVYYELAGCDPADYAFTTITPTPTLGIGQQYVLPGSPNKFYTYTGSTLVTCVVPGPYNGSIQATVNTGCP